MIVEKHITDHLSKTKCHKCGMSLDGARLTPISKVPLALVAYAVCSNCLAESIVTITLAGSEAASGSSDLKNEELQKFLGLKPTSQDELFELHGKLKRKSIWKLLQQDEKYSERKIKTLETTEKSRP